MCGVSSWYCDDAQGVKDKASDCASGLTSFNKTLPTAGMMKTSVLSLRSQCSSFLCDTSPFILSCVLLCEGFPEWKASAAGYPGGCEKSVKT